MVAHEDEFAIHHQIDTFPRVWAITHHVTEAINIGNPLSLDIGQDGLKGLKIAMDIADDRLHNEPTAKG